MRNSRGAAVAENWVPSSRHISRKFVESAAVYEKLSKSA